MSFGLLFLFFLTVLLLQPTNTHAQIPIPTWRSLSTTADDLDIPFPGTEQTSSLILDVDNDGADDFVIGGRTPPGPSLVWYKRTDDGWLLYPIENDVLYIEAGGAFHDIDSDGDLDVVMGGDYRSNQVWWWENPYPNYAADTDWTRRLIKNSGANMHHDQVFGDFDGDGTSELVFWNQFARSLMLAEIPVSPRQTEPWQFVPIYTWPSGAEHEGLEATDIDGDGDTDIVGGGRWFEHMNGTTYVAHVIDDSQRFSRVATGQIIPGGYAEVVFVVGDGFGRLKWYHWTGNGWSGIDLLGYNVNHGHSLQIDDINRDGYVDIFVAEMRLDNANPGAMALILYGDGTGTFQTTSVSTGYGNHESRLGDLDGDGDLDILGKPYNWSTPRLDLWINELPTCAPQFDAWSRRLLDESRPWRAIFIDTGDINADGFRDVVTGGWWYRNPGSPAGEWTRNTIGSPLYNMAVVHDFDQDSDLDILGTQGIGANANSSFVWARNNGSGWFTIFDNIPAGQGDFLQGAVVDRFRGELGWEVALSWHALSSGVQSLTVPADPSNTAWAWQQIASITQEEQLSAGDIDGDGDSDLLLGTQWLRNQPSSWDAYTLNPTPGLPDRNRLGDINLDGRLDAVVGYETLSTPGRVAWYEQPPDPTGEWTEHIIAQIIAPMSLDVADMDGDGDLDVVAGEHNTESPSSARLYVFENMDAGTTWTAHLVYTGDEHHDGTNIVDIDGDGDMDIVSIGWTHNRVVLYENLTPRCTTQPPTTPVAHAGEATRIPVGGIIKLDGSRSEVPSGHSVQWLQTGGPEPVIVTGADTLIGTFSPTQTGVYSFTLGITLDAQVVASDTATLLAVAAIPMPSFDEYGAFQDGRRTHSDEVDFVFSGGSGDMALSLSAWDVDTPSELAVFVNGQFAEYVSPINAVQEVSASRQEVDNEWTHHVLTLSDALIADGAANLITIRRDESGPSTPLFWGVKDMALGRLVVSPLALPAPDSYGYFQDGMQVYPDQVAFVFDGQPGDLTLNLDAWNVGQPDQIAVILNGIHLSYLPTISGADANRARSISIENEWTEHEVRLPEALINDQSTNLIVIDNIAYPAQISFWGVRNVRVAPVSAAELPRTPDRQFLPLVSTD